MTHAADLKHITTWLKQLAELCRPGSEPVTKDKLATYATFLKADFPIAAFVQESVSTIAKGHEYFPHLASLHKHLFQWWKDHRPPPLPDPVPRLTFADDIARQADNRASWNDPVAIRSSVRLVLSSPIQQLSLGRMLGKAVAVNAPHHLGLVPAEWHPAEGDRL